MLSESAITTFTTHTKALAEIEKCHYRNSAFQIYKHMSSKKKGAAFEAIVQEYCTQLGYTVTKPENSDHDRIINGKKVEIKGSMLWSGTNTHFRWQQLRPAQDYDVVVFLAIFPDRIEFYGATKDDVKNNLEVQNENGEWLYNQHGGKKVNSGTFFLDSIGTNIPDWFTSIDEVLA